MLFVSRTPKGELLRQIRKREGDLQKVLGNKVKCVEKAGRKLESILVQKDPWEGEMCRGRVGGGSCLVCREEGKKAQCLARNIIYRHTCLLCKNDGKSTNYWGMTCRSFVERVQEHERDFKNGVEGTHA